MAMAVIEAHITGTIFKIEKQVGDRVSEGDDVIILESMKMEIPLESPIDGTITEIRVEEGQAVDEGVVVAVVE
jgi:acetyl-CoA carboxylase biotin carboxyl carrier protein